MKKILLSIAILLFVLNTYSQTNTFPTNGNVGIGTLNPISKLDISTINNAIINVSGGQAGYINAALVLKATHSTNYRGLGMFMYDTNGRNEWFVGRPYAGSDQFVIYRNDNVSSHADWSAATRDGAGKFTGVKAFFKISSTGNVGIGTLGSDTAYKLSVNGKIRAKEIKVEADWADFVFEEDYKLRSLNELEQFIQKNRHLPDIPTEKEVDAEGISLGVMNSKLLQKIEEQTLYILQLQKQLELVNKRLDKIEKSN